MAPSLALSPSLPSTTPLIPDNFCKYQGLTEIDRRFLEGFPITALTLVPPPEPPTRSRSETPGRNIAVEDDDWTPYYSAGPPEPDVLVQETRIAKAKDVNNDGHRSSARGSRQPDRFANNYLPRSAQYNGRRHPMNPPKRRRDSDGEGPSRARSRQRNTADKPPNRGNKHNPTETANQSDYPGPSLHGLSQLLGIPVASKTAKGCDGSPTHGRESDETVFSIVNSWLHAAQLPSLPRSEFEPELLCQVFDAMLGRPNEGHPATVDDLRENSRALIARLKKHQSATKNVKQIQRVLSSFEDATGIESKEQQKIMDTHRELHGVFQNGLKMARRKEAKVRLNNLIRAEEADLGTQERKAITTEHRLQAISKGQEEISKILTTVDSTGKEIRDALQILRAEIDAFLDTPKET
jgi:hypothetical protein